MRKTRNCDEVRYEAADTVWDNTERMSWTVVDPGVANRLEMQMHVLTEEFIEAVRSNVASGFYVIAFAMKTYEKQRT